MFTCFSFRAFPAAAVAAAVAPTAVFVADFGVVTSLAFVLLVAALILVGVALLPVVVVVALLGDDLRCTKPLAELEVFAVPPVVARLDALLLVIITAGVDVVFGAGRAVKVFVVAVEVFVRFVEAAPVADVVLPTPLVAATVFMGLLAAVPVGVGPPEDVFEA